MLANKLIRFFMNKVCSKLTVLFCSFTDQSHYRCTYFHLIKKFKNYFSLKRTVVPYASMILSCIIRVSVWFPTSEFRVERPKYFEPPKLILVLFSERFSWFLPLWKNLSIFFLKYHFIDGKWFRSVCNFGDMKILSSFQWIRCHLEELVPVAWVVTMVNTHSTHFRSRKVS